MDEMKKIFIIRKMGDFQRKGHTIADTYGYGIDLAEKAVSEEIISRLDKIIPFLISRSEIDREDGLTEYSAFKKKFGVD